MVGIPEIDISGFLAGDAAASKRVYAEVNDALKEVGFFTIVGHGVPMETISGLRNGAKAFFDMPPEDKLRFANPRGSISRGYVGIGKENLGRTLGGATIDVKEQLAFGRFDVPDTAYYRQPFAATAFEPNVLPDVPDGFGETVRDYYRELESLTQTLLRIFAGALELQPDFFVEFFDKHTSVMRIINYPDQSGMKIDAAAQTRSGAHTDYGALTILLAEKALGGLQVKLRHGDWVDVDPKPDAFIVNIGDLMAMWTNDHWVSNLHRVSNPPPNPGQSTRRLSVAYFAHANYDAMIRCIPTCMSDTVSAKHPPVLAGEHRKAKVGLSKAS